MIGDSDTLLMQRWHAEHDAHAFREIASRHSQMVFATCKRILRNTSDAEDITQECFLTLAQHEGSPPQSLAAWLYTVAVHQSLNRLRTLGHQSKRERKYAEKSQASNAPTFDAIMAEVDEAIAALPEELRAPLVLQFLEERSQAEIAAQFSLSQATVSRRVNQGIEHIRATLKRKGIASTVVAIVGVLESQASVAAPAGLAASMGKLAIAGATGGATTSASITTAASVGGFIAVKKTVAITVAAVAVILGAIWYSQHPSETSVGKSAQISQDVKEAPQAPPNERQGHPVIHEKAPPNAPAVVTEPKEQRNETVSGGAVFGRTYDAVTGEGIAGVEVNAAWGSDRDTRQERTAKSAANGNYRIEGLDGPAGTSYRITRNAPEGYRDLTYMEEVSMQIDAEGRSQPVDFAMEAEVPLEGIVVDITNQPVAGANVNLAGGVDIFVSKSTETDSNGAFQFHNLGPTGDLHVAASKDDAGLSEPMELALTESGREDLILVLQDACSISGVIVSSSGRPLQDYEVKVRRDPDTRLGVGRDKNSDASGRFQITALAPGEYELIGMNPKIRSSGAQQRGIRIELRPGQHLTGVKVVYNRDLSIAGRVLTADGKPLSGARITAGSPEFGGGTESTTDDQGHFQINELEIGIYSVDIRAKGYQFEQIYEVPAGTQDLHIVASEPYRITGRILDAKNGQPIPEFEIALTVNWGEDVESWDMMHFEKFVSADGSFELEKQQSYRAMIAARADGYATAFEFLDLTGPPYDHDVSLKLEHGGDLNGRVVDTQGNPIAGASVYMGRALDYGDRATTKSASDGSFSLPSFPVQRQSVSAYHPDYAVGSIVMEPGAERSQPVEIVLGPGGTIHGVISFAEGARPVPCSVDVSYPDRGHTLSSHRVEVAGDGTYRVEHVRPGEAEVTVFVNAKEGWRHGFMVKKNAIVDDEGETLVDFTIYAAIESLEGRVKYPSGALPRNVSVKLNVETPNGTYTRMRLVPTDGNFQFDDIPTGSGHIEVDANFQNHRRISEQFPVTIGEEGNANFEIQL